MNNNGGNDEHYLKSRLAESFTYRRFSTEPAHAHERSFTDVTIDFFNRSITGATIKVSSNFLMLEHERVKFNLVNLYLRANGTRCVTLSQKQFALNMEFATESDATGFKAACDNFVVRENVWDTYFSMRELDKGAFSTVRLARKHSSYSELFAVKEMRKDGVDEKAFRYLEMELYALRNVRNECALKLFEIYEDATSIYLITEYLNNGTLEKKIKNRENDEETARKVLNTVLSVIIELNKYNIVHRDIKPANIMFTLNKANQETCKLIDFGLCADLTDQSATSLLRDKSGTVCYLAPELIGWDLINQMYNEQVDVFSLGMILYEM